MLSEISPSQKDKYCMIPNTGIRYLDCQMHRSRKPNGSYQGLGEGKWSINCLMGIEFQLFQMKNVLEMSGGDIWTTMQMFLMPLKYIIRKG